MRSCARRDDPGAHGLQWGAFENLADEPAALAQSSALLPVASHSLVDVDAGAVVCDVER